MRKLEEIARGMAADQFERSGNEPDTKAGYIELVYPVLMPLALAAVRAMRVPSEVMKQAGADCLDNDFTYGSTLDAEHVWQRMIDALLSEDGEC